MAIDIKLPELGEGISSGDVLEVLVAVGDKVEKGQSLVELETEKATLSVPADRAGLIESVHVSPGQTVQVGDRLVSLAAEPPAASAPKPSSSPKKETPPPPAAESTKAKSKPTSTPAAKTKPTTQPSPIPAAVAPSPPSQPESDEETAASEPSPRRSTKRSPAPVAAASAPAPAAPPRPGGGGLGHVPAGPAIRRFAREVGVDLGRVTGSGAGGRITREDVLHVVRRGGNAPASASTLTPAGAAAPAGQRDAFGPIRTEKLTRIRRTIAEQMHLSWTTVPRVTNFDDCDVTDLEEFRRESRDDYAKQGIKLTSLPFVVKAVAMALKNHPLINASIDLDAGAIIYKEYVNVGIAVDTPRGLVVPVLPAADQRSIPSIAKEVQSMADQARAGTFKLEDLRGGTFTISNLGSIGGTYSTPIINVPESAILLIGRARKMPIVIEDKLALRLMLPLSLSYDHRLVDGSTAARFLNDVIGYLQAPSRLLLAP